MSKVIYRTVGPYSHILNVATGEIMTFKITVDEAKYLVNNWKDPDLELQSDVTELFSANGHANTRMCRTHLTDLGMEFGFPTVVNIELNRRCSLRCIHCYIGKSNLETTELGVFESMPLSRVSLLLDQLKDMRVFLLALTGGEPFLNRRIRKIVDMAICKGFVVEIFSNLQNLPSWIKTGNSEEMMIGRVQVSVYSSNPKVHDSVTTVKGSFDRTMENLLYLHSNGFYVEVATPLMLPNYSTWRATENLFSGLNIRQDFSWPILSEYYSEESDTASLNINGQQLQKFLSFHPDFLIKKKLGKSKKPPCGIGRYVFSIVANGDVYPCSQLPLPVGNILQNSIDNIYRSDKMQGFRNIRCCDTGLSSAYNYCLGENFTETGEYFKQSPKISAIISEALKSKKGGD